MTQEQLEGKDYYNLNKNRIGQNSAYKDGEDIVTDSSSVVLKGVYDNIVIMGRLGLGSGNLYVQEIEPNGEKREIRMDRKSINHVREFFKSWLP